MTAELACCRSSQASPRGVGTPKTTLFGAGRLGLRVMVVHLRGIAGLRHGLMLGEREHHAYPRSRLACHSPLLCLLLPGRCRSTLRSGRHGHSHCRDRQRDRTSASARRLYPRAATRIRMATRLLDAPRKRMALGRRRMGSASAWVHVGPGPLGAHAGWELAAHPWPLAGFGARTTGLSSSASSVAQPTSKSPFSSSSVTRHKNELAATPSTMRWS
jgi:hypothetical protein